jgi:hypothetical protein
MNSELRYQKHIAYAATQGLNAGLALKRLKMLSPLTARQLFGATEWITHRISKCKQHLAIPRMANRPFFSAVPQSSYQ